MRWQFRWEYYIKKSPTPFDSYRTNTRSLFLSLSILNDAFSTLCFFPPTKSLRVRCFSFYALFLWQSSIHCSLTSSLMYEYQPKRAWNSKANAKCLAKPLIVPLIGQAHKYLRTQDFEKKNAVHSESKFRRKWRKYWNGMKKKIIITRWVLQRSQTTDGARPLRKMHTCIIKDPVAGKNKKKRDKPKVSIFGEHEKD